jgi:hypothetical protein
MHIRGEREKSSFQYLGGQQKPLKRTSALPQVKVTLLCGKNPRSGYETDCNMQRDQSVMQQDRTYKDYFQEKDDLQSYRYYHSWSGFFYL